MRHEEANERIDESASALNGDHAQTRFEFAETRILYRPVGPKELALIAAGGYRKFPPRLPEQPISMLMELRTELRHEVTGLPTH